MNMSTALGYVAFGVLSLGIVLLGVMSMRRDSLEKEIPCPGDKTKSSPKTQPKCTHCGRCSCYACSKCKGMGWLPVVEEPFITQKMCSHCYGTGDSRGPGIYGERGLKGQPGDRLYVG